VNTCASPYFPLFYMYLRLCLRLSTMTFLIVASHLIINVKKEKFISATRHYVANLVGWGGGESVLSGTAWCLRECEGILCTLVAGGASACGEGNQMAEKTRIQTSFFPWWYADSLNEEGSLSSSRTRSEHPRLGTRLARTYSRSKIARRPYNTSLTSSRLSSSKSV
jgi:hypothetical protein